MLPMDVMVNVESDRSAIVPLPARTCGFGGEVAAIIAEKALLHLEAPILRVTGYDTPFPYTLENQYLPDAFKIYEACERTVDF